MFRNRTLRRAVWVPLAYLAVFFLLVWTQFSRGEEQTQSWGTWTLITRSGGGAGDDGAVDLQLVQGRTVLALSAAQPALLETPDGAQYRSRPRSVSAEGERLQIELQRDIRLTLTRRRDQSLTIRLTGGESLFSAVHLPWNPQGERRFEGRLLLTEEGGFWTSGAGDGFDPDKGLLTLRPRGGQFQPVDYARGSADQVLTRWAGSFFEDPAPRWRRYRDQAYQALLNGRLTSPGIWEPAGQNTPDLSAQALLSEAQQRGALAQALAAAGGVNGPLSSPWLGDIVNQTVQRRRDWALNAARPEAWTWALRPEGPGLTQALIWGSAGQAEDLAARLRDLIPSSPEQAAAALVEAQAFTRWRPQADFTRVSDLSAQLLIRSIGRFSDGFFVVNNEGYRPLRVSLIGGLALSEWGRRRNNEDARQLGLALQNSALALADARGLLRELLIPVAGSDQPRREGWVRPEEVFPYLSSGLPYEVLDLGREWGAGRFLLAPAAPTALSFGSEEIRLTWRVAPGTPLHLVVQGLEVFDHIRLHDIRWRSDPTFQRYSDGWLYVPSTRSLYVKITARTPEEHLVIRLVPDAPGSSAAGAPSSLPPAPAPAEAASDTP